MPGWRNEIGPPKDLIVDSEHVDTRKRLRKAELEPSRARGADGLCVMYKLINLATDLADMAPFLEVALVGVAACAGWSRVDKEYSDMRVSGPSREVAKKVLA